MSNVIKECVGLFNEFSKESFDWCAKESEKATSRVSEILDIIVEDADRVSKMSEDTLNALETMKELIGSLSTGERNIDKANKLSQALTDLSNENLEVQEMIQQGEPKTYIIDVRTPSEHEEDKVPGSLNIPLLLLRKNLRKLKEDAVYVVMCDGGKRAQLGAYQLNEEGYSAYVLKRD